MRILFVTSEHPARLCGGLGTFTREFVKELRKYADVKCVCFNLSGEDFPAPDKTVDYVFSPQTVFEAFSPDARILETTASFRAQVEPVIKEFKPDVIHCNDRQTYLPFRFDKNVLYSSHLIFTDLISSSALSDVYFQEIKVERCALENSAVLAVYSDFAAKSASRLITNNCVPIVLPLGLRTENFLSKEPRKSSFLYKKISGKKVKRPLVVSYFGRFENTQKGINNFINAVNLLGLDFKIKYNLQYNLYGQGQIDSRINTFLFDNVIFLEGKKLFEAYKNSDIVVMPSRYEPFGFTGLEAMASGALVLLTSGLGMDMYAKPGINCLSIPIDSNGIAVILKNAITDFDKYAFIRKNAEETARKWTWKRCIHAHLFIYRQIIKKRISQLASAYRQEERKLILEYKKISQSEKNCLAEQEKSFVLKMSNILNQEDFFYTEGNTEFDEYGKCIEEIQCNRDNKILFLTASYNSVSNEFSNNVTVVSTLEENSFGIVIRPECLPFNDEEFDYVVAIGSWETVMDPCGALVEMQRVCKNEVIVFYNKGIPHSWQTFKMENPNDWKNISRSFWNVSGDWNKETALTLGIEKDSAFGAAIYSKKIDFFESSAESIA